jgi:hypothetical protein
MRNRALLSAIVWLCAATAPAAADAISEWNQKAVAFGAARQMPPPHAERVMALVHLAMFDALNSIDRRYRPGVVQLNSSAKASKEAAAAAAAGTVLAGLDPKSAVEISDAMTAYLAVIPAGEAKSEGIRLGEAVAARVLQARANDGSGAADAYRPKARPGIYVPTAITVGSAWPNVKPFAMTSPGQFRPPAPIALNSEEWSIDYNEIKDLGGRTSVRRSARQTEDARFWLAPGPGIYYPAVRQLAAAKKLNLLDSARFMALIALARSDAFVAVFDAKYHYDFWRPITAIRNGDTDDNPRTERDATWQPIDITPPHPEYPCAHCIMAASIASVVESVFGTADVPEVALTSPTAPGVTHRWTNIWVRTEEVSQARILAGFHYRFSTRVGRDMGGSIGQYVVKSMMQPVTVAGTR